ncbi:NUDIX domain-containing protein [Listeria monocytogenes]|uniref:NUDIX domain-containing protein n=1 Tax=Listeria monocytogenes TaxID=1639 RepID=A0A9Q7MU53_LISMN|nr:NUDIX hydrolase [Listeria monocytogenes]EAD5036029.1 NUDIX domain-containing protein [Listeria monocytogenes serotype 1/2a]ANE39148.1 DNA mismatch repair protein MutT [Listeria monocytogenes]EAA0252643.1 NUDIX domain-containing protein [Listeria monocytogenes]EAC2272345.1 NUDIX domain-containing protein [Listeria monocytogenes]EAC2368320.1 NUDIX domain-containing protein [Listeria monocytogenes]
MKHIRTAAIITHQNKILLHSNQEEDYWTLSGGAVENESTKEGLKREMKEELGEDVAILELSIIAENRFLHRGEEIDSIEFYYVVKLFPDSKLLNQATFTKIEEFGQYGEEAYKLHFKWFDMDKLKNITILPTFLETELANLSRKNIIHLEQST